LSTSFGGRSTTGTTDRHAADEDGWDRGLFSDPPATARGETR
jgi:hypothetical protein